MYNNIKKFVNPKYATIFLFCVTVLLVIIFMKSRKEPFTKSEQKEVDAKLNKDIASVNTAIKDTDVIKNLRDNKANTSDLASYATKSQLASGLGSKLNTADFGKTLAADITKLNTADFGSTLAKDATIKGLNTDVGGLKKSVSTLNTGKLDISTYNTDKSTMPTTDNINTWINNAVTSKVGTINSAKTAYDKAYDDFNDNKLEKTRAFNENAKDKKDDFNDNAKDKKDDFNSNAGAKTNSFNNNADAKTNSFNSNASTKYGQVDALKSAAETAKTAAESAKTVAVQAQVDSQKIYDDVFKEVSGRVITQSNVYRNGFKFNERTGYYESQSESFTTIEGLVSDDTFTKEKRVIQDINAFNAKYYDYLSCKADSSKCPQGKTATNLKNDLLELSATLQGSIASLKTEYTALGRDTDNTQSLLDKAAQIDDLRQDLDAKMARIIESKNPPNEMTQQLDSTVYAGILWSVLGTSLLYYIFTE